jgi:HEAT repeat protein
MEDRSADPVPLSGDLIAILRYLSDPAGLPFLLQCLRVHPEEVQDDLLDAFCRLGKKAVDPLLELYQEMGPERGAEVAFVLAALQIRDSRILDLLLSRLELDPGDAAFLLGMYGDVAAKPRLLEALVQWESRAQGSSWEAQELREAIYRLEHTEPVAALQPYNIWEDFPEYEPPQFDILTEEEVLGFLESPVADYRVAAASNLRSRQLSGTAVARLLELASNDPEPSVRASCWEALSDTLDNPTVRNLMMLRLADPEAPMIERCGALIGMAAEADDPAVRSRILEFYDRPDARAKALEAMWRSLDRRFAEYFPRHLKDSDPEIRRQAIMGIGFLGISTEAGKLRAFFDDEEFRSEALYAYALSMPTRITRSGAPRLLAEIYDLAGGLSHAEEQLVKAALDDRLLMHGLAPFFQDQETEAADTEE